MLNSVETPKVVQFKATNNAKASRNYSQAPMPIGRDSYVKQKEDSKEKWYKAGVIAGVVIAASLGAKALMGALQHSAKIRMYSAQAAESLARTKLIEQDIGKNIDSAATLADDAVKSLWRSIEKEKS